MIAVIAEVAVQPDRVAEFELIVAELTAAVADQEPGNLTYRLVRSRTEHGHYRFFEVYYDREALEVHGRSEHFTAASRRMTPLLAATPKIEYFDTVAEDRT
ncbi:putative quinol monooxygenase [Nocardia salmonicida]|uniref:putative quinol monooxygenase n=1 Tax=Nocardia salmonicida TaxID=53431 RepID=UPI0036371642